MELEQLKQQTELVSREYTLRHNQIEGELSQQKTLVSKLMEENEGFQYLLAEKAILGGFASDAEDSDGDEHMHFKRHYNYHKKRAQSSSEKSTSSKQGDTKESNTRNDGTLTRSESKSLQTNNSLAEELEQLSINEEAIEEEELGEDLDESAKKKLYDLEFEVRSLRNHNKALSTSLERLVHRLLEFKQFEQEVETSTMSGSINAASISQFQTRVASSSDSMRSNSVGSRGFNGFLPTSATSGSGYASNDGSSSQLNLHPVSSNSSSHGHTIIGGVPTSKRTRHGTRDSVSSTTSSLAKHSRPIKNSSLWNNMLLGGSSGVNSVGNFGHAAAGSRMSIMSSTSLTFTPGMSSLGVSSPTTSVMHLGLDGDTSPSSSGSTTGSVIRRPHTPGSIHSNSNTTLAGGHRFSAPHFSVSGGNMDPLSRASSPSLFNNSSVTGSSASSIISMEDGIISGVQSAIQDEPRRPSTNSQRGLRPLTIYAQSS